MVSVPSKCIAQPSSKFPLVLGGGGYHLAFRSSGHVVLALAVGGCRRPLVESQVDGRRCLDEGVPPNNDHCHNPAYATKNCPSKPLRVSEQLSGQKRLPVYLTDHSAQFSAHFLPETALQSQNPVLHPSSRVAVSPSTTSATYATLSCPGQAVDLPSRLPSSTADHPSSTQKPHGSPPYSAAEAAAPTGLCSHGPYQLEGLCTGVFVGCDAF